MPGDLRSATLADHPITAGVGEFGTFAALDVRHTPWPPASLGTYAGGQIIGAYNPLKRIVVINWYAHDGDWGGDFPRLLQNALEYCRTHTSWLRTDPWDLTIPPGGEGLVQAAFETRILEPGTYAGSLEIVHNTGGDPLLVPVTLKVVP